MFNNTDNELQRYEEAELYSATATPDMFSDIKSQFNTVTGETDLLAPLPSGGFVRLASQAPDIMVEAPTMPGMGADAALPVEGPIARAAEQTALETEPAKPQIRGGLANRMEIAREAVAGLARGGVETAQFIDETLGGLGGIQVQFVDPATGEFDLDIRVVSAEERAETKRKMAAGVTPYAFDLETLTEADKDASGVAGAAGGISQFLGAYLGIGKLFRVGAGFTRAMAQGAAADFLAFDGSDKAVTDMLLDMGWIEPNMITELLKKDPTDPDYVGRFQAAVEGAGLGAFIEKAMIPFLGLAFRAVKDKDVPVDAARQAIQQGKLMMQGALLKAGQNAELRIKERGTGTTLNMGGDPMALTDPLVAAAGRAVGGDRVAEIKTRMQQIQDDRRISKTLSGEGELRKLKRELKEIDQSGDGNFSIIEPPTDTKPGIIAFHGSAADFDGFKLEKIGTGEGAQMYGYGLYFADKEEIAKFYKESLTEVPFDYQIDGQSVSAMYNQAINNENYELAEVLEQVQLHDAPKDLKERFTIDGGYSQETQDFVRDLDYDNLTGVNADGEEIELGRVYKVGLTPKPEDLLDYDKPFNEQTPAIQAALKKAGYKTERNMVVKEDGDNRFGVYETNDDGTETLLKHFTEPMLFKGPLEKQAQDFIVEQNAELLNNTGGDILTDLIRLFEAQDFQNELYGRGNRIASELMAEFGIPGIKYRAAGSRGANVADADAGRNYVIFDDSMIKILEKYGIVGPVAISAMALSEDES